MLKSNYLLQIFAKLYFPLKVFHPGIITRSSVLASDTLASPGHNLVVSPRAFTNFLLSNGKRRKRGKR